MDNDRIQRIIRRMVLIITVIFVGSVWLTRFLYQTFEGEALSISQSIVFLIQTYTTTGYGELLPFRSPVMNIYASVQMVLGVALILVGLATAAAAWLQTHFQEIPPVQVSDKLNRHIIICGYTPLTDALLEDLRKLNIPYVIVERRSGTVRELMKDGKTAIHGDPTNQQTLEHAGIDRARALITTESDETNLHVVLEARSISTLPILAALEDENLREALELAGATDVLSPKRVLGEELARIATSSLGHRLVADIDGIGGLSIMEFPIGMYCQYANQTIRESRIRETTGATILGIWENGLFRLVDSPDMVLSEESMVVVLGTDDQLKALENNMNTHLYAPGQQCKVFVVGGYGDVAKQTVNHLAEKQMDMRLIVNAPVPGHTHVVGDLDSKRVLLDAGIKDACTYILSAPTDEKAIFSVLIARHLNPDLRIFVRANNHNNVKKIYRAGADFVISVSKVSGTMLTNLLDKDAKSGIPDMDIHFFRHNVGQELDGQTIQESSLLSLTNSIVIAIKKGDEIIQNPGASTILSQGDVLVILASRERMEQFNALTEA